MSIFPNQQGGRRCYTHKSNSNGGSKLLQQLINVHTALSIRQSFILLILRKGPQKKTKYIIENRTEPEEPQTMMEEGGSGVESDAMAIVALVALIQDNHHHRKGEGTSRFAIIDRQKKKTYESVSGIGHIG